MVDTRNPMIDTRTQLEQAVDQWSRTVELYEDAREDCINWMEHHFDSIAHPRNGEEWRWERTLTEKDHQELSRLENRLRLVSMQRGYAWELVGLHRRLDQSTDATTSPNEEEAACLITWAR